MVNQQLPIDKVLGPLRQALEGHAAAVLQAPPGAGKTTRVPLALLDEGWLAGKTIVMLEPRRLAATNAARYMARQLGERVGGRVGYRIRYEQQISPATRIEVVTEGILIRRLQQDPELGGVGLIIFDEFHERNLYSDLALALCRDVQLGLRDDLRLLVMSATLDAEPVARLLDDCPLISSVGRSFPVEIRYLSREPRGFVEDFTPPAVRRALAETEGDVLVFLPGAGEIHRCAEALADLSGQVDIRPLYGNLPFNEQERTLLPGKRRRLVLATNIAETSLTIEGISVVVDAGFERRPRFDAGRAMSALALVRISRASAEQRAGRAGRCRAGICYRLWSEGGQGALLPFAPAEIGNADLATLALELACWGVTDAGQLAWLDPPPAGRLVAAGELLHQLGALDGQGRLTPCGRRMADLSAHPRISRLLVAAQELGNAALGADLAALLEEQQPGRGRVFDLLDRLQQLERRGSESCLRAARYWRRKLGGRGERGPVAAHVVGRLLALAYPDRIGRQREAGSGRYHFSGGSGGYLPPLAAVRSPEWLVALEIMGKAGGDGEIRLAVELGRDLLEELFGNGLPWRRELDWDERAGRVQAREVRRLGALLLQERPASATTADLLPALLALLRRKGLGLLAWNDAARQLRARGQLIASRRSDWPDLSDEALLARLEEWLAPYLQGVTDLAGLRRVDLVGALQAFFGRRWPELERLVPERLPVPSGSRIRLDYLAAEGPVLACKLQELFGLAETPTVVEGAPVAERGNSGSF
ncbi:MAG: ATP-dependent helicase HrpB [Desulfuromonadaceae bacterium]